jgi:hypothetical protein
MSTSLVLPFLDCHQAQIPVKNADKLGRSSVGYYK